MNEFNIVGKVLGNLDIKKSENGTNYAQMLLSVKRPFKNKDGKQDFDILQLTMFNNCIEDSKDQVSDGSLVIVKGHINSNNYPKDGKTIYNSSIIADRVSLIENLA